MDGRAQVGVGVIVRKGGDILLLQRKGSHGEGTWSVPGGHIDAGETPEECAIREVMEETGVTVGNPHFLGITNDVFENEGKHYVTLWTEATYVSGEPRITSPRETFSVGWHAMDAIPSPRFLPFQHYLDGKMTKS